MADWQLPTTVEYVTTTEAYAVQSRLMHGDLVGLAGKQQTMMGLLVLSGLTLGMVAALKAGRTTSTIIILACGIAIGVRLWRPYRQTRECIEGGFKEASGKSRRLDITADGFTEHDCGIKSFCPWSAMKNYALVDDVLLVELANGLWALIPGATLKPESITLEQIAASLEHHQVARRT